MFKVGDTVRCSFGDTTLIGEVTELGWVVPSGVKFRVTEVTTTSCHFFKVGREEWSYSDSLELISSPEDYVPTQEGDRDNDI